MAVAPWAAHGQSTPPAILQQRLAQLGLADQGLGYARAEIDGATLRFDAAGRTQREGGAAIDEDTPFEIGSISKTFIALLLADAVVSQALPQPLRLHDAVEDALPGAPKLRDTQGEPLRWIDLATHRSGLPRLARNMAPRDPADPYAGYSLDDLMAFIRAWQPTRRRDERFEYSNLGFGLLGQALALRAQRPLASLLAERVFEPLGLSGITLSAPSTQRQINGHNAQGHPVPIWHFGEATAGAGGLVGTARSLARYAQAALGQFEHPLKEAFALCLRRHADGAAAINPIGLAWTLAPLNGRTVFNHDGRTFGFASSLWLDPQRGRAAVLLANADVPVTDLALHTLDASLPLRDVTPRPAVRLGAAQLDILMGRYALNANFSVLISSHSGRLFAQATGQGEFELFASTPRRFFARVAALDIVFDGDEGVPAAFTLNQGGASQRFVRLSP